MYNNKYHYYKIEDNENTRVQKKHPRYEEVYGSIGGQRGEETYDTLRSAGISGFYTTPR